MTTPSRAGPILAAAVIAGLSFAGSPRAQTIEPPPSSIQVPPSGMAATVQGGRIILLPNGTWRLDHQMAKQHVTAITDDGHYVHLSPGTDAEGGVVPKWSYTGSRGGPIQVLITRATPASSTYDTVQTSCVPVVSVRNLTLAKLDHVLVEILFESTDGQRRTMSAMIGPFNHGEEVEQVGPSLDMGTCRGIRGQVHVVSCRFTNGVPCQYVTRASAFGVIPLRMADVEIPDWPEDETGPEDKPGPADAAGATDKTAPAK